MILRKFLFFLGVCLALGSCANRLICPAYQSTFIHDKETLRQKFSYFYNDSTPKVLTASKTKYLVAVPESYRKRYRKMQTVSMQEIHPVIPDSLQDKEDEELAEMETLVSDSLAVPMDSLSQAKADSASVAAAADSVYMITKDKELRILKYNFPDSLHYDPVTGRYVKETPKYFVDEVGYNAEQQNYMWYFRKELILPDVRLSKVAEANKNKPPVVEKKPFFQRLMFWKKKKPTDSLVVAPVNEFVTDSLDYDFDQDIKPIKKPTAPVEEPKKKGLFKRKGSPPPSDPLQPAKKEDEDGL
jgi:hypothetical protein